MFEQRLERIKASLNSPFDPAQDLAPQANRLQAGHLAHLDLHPIPDKDLRGRSFSELSQYLQEPANQRIVATTVREFVKLVHSSETNFYSESHDLFHVAEMVGSLLDDRARGITTDNATVLVTTGFALIHDLGRRIEKLVTTGQVDLSTDLHHDVLSFQSADKLLRTISREVQMPLETRKAFVRLLFPALHFAQNTDFEPFLAIPEDTDRRQLLGSATLGRDILYFGGMQEKDLSPASILGFPPGYTHYDSGGFFGQQDWASRYVYRDSSIIESRGLNAVYDNLTKEAMTILFLACGGNEKLLDSLKIIPDLPSGKITDSQGKPWMLRKPLSNEEIWESAEQQAHRIEGIFTGVNLSAEQAQDVFRNFAYAYGTIIEEGHLETVLGNVGQFSSEDRVKWASILGFAHYKNLQRYVLRRSVLAEELSRGTFLGEIAEPFVEVLESRRPYQNKVTEFFESIRAA